jgi:hypothetical protein
MGQNNEDPQATDSHDAATDDAASEIERVVTCSEVDSPSTEAAGVPSVDRSGDHNLINAVESNADLLQQLLVQFEGLYEIVHQGKSPAGPSEERSADSGVAVQLYVRIDELEEELEELRQQNEDLAAQVASSNVQQAVSSTSSGGSDALSWEDRKKLILKQLEDESFDAESFVASIQDESVDEDDDAEMEDPAEFVQHLYNELERRNVEITKRDEEIHEYRCLIQAKSETREGGLAVGAAAIAEIVDADELIQEERERLQMLQTEWEEKFREGEIQASLERAKLSRERKALANKQAALEQELERVRRQTRLSEEYPDSGSAPSRRWMVKLGLNDKEEDKEEGKKKGKGKGKRKG